MMFIITDIKATIFFSVDNHDVVNGASSNAIRRQYFHFPLPFCTLSCIACNLVLHVFQVD